jgi:phosphate-selective porin OprO/OprP
MSCRTIRAIFVAQSVALAGAPALSAAEPEPLTAAEDRQAPAAATESTQTQPTPAAAGQEPPASQAALPVTTPAAATKEQATKPAAVSRPGFIISTAHGDHLTVGGYLHFEAREYGGKGSSAYVNQFLFRRVRPVLEGTVHNHIDFRLMPDFAGGKAVVVDAWADLRYVPFFKLRLGKFKEPMSLERLQSSNATVLAERAFPVELAPNRNLGVQAFGDLGGLATYEVGLFNVSIDNDFSAADSDIANAKEVAGRLFLTPFARSGWAPLKGLGFGASGSFSRPQGTAANPLLGKYVSAGQNTLASYVTGNGGDGKPSLALTAVAAGDHNRFDVQGYYYWGPFGAHAEYILEKQRVRLDTVALTAENWAWEATASLVLTGEKATFGMLGPEHPFDPAGGSWGAVELTGRYQVLHLDTALLSHGLIKSTSPHGADAWGAGLNWYLNRAVRFQANYDHTQYHGGGAGGDRLAEQVVIVRAQTVF